MVAVRNLRSPAQETHEMLFEHDSLRTVRLQLDAGESLPAHSHPGAMVLFYVLDGRIKLSLDGEAHLLSAGEILQFGGDQDIAPAAPVAATALVVIANSAE